LLHPLLDPNKENFKSKIKFVRCFSSV
jgi:hypothetical protein